MTSQPLSDEAEHLAVQQVLPWYGAGALCATEQAMVARHLDTCAACRADVTLQRQVRLAEPALPAGLDVEAALARLMPRLDHVAPSGAAPVSGSRAGTGAVSPWRGRLLRLLDALGGGWRNWALAVQCLVIAGLGVALWSADGGQARDTPVYRALGSGAVAAPDVVVMFQPEARLADVQRVLQASGARIVDGPTVTGAYLVDVEAARMPQLLAVLRTDPAVRLAEPLGARAAP